MNTPRRRQASTPFRRASGFRIRGAEIPTLKSSKLKNDARFEHSNILSMVLVSDLVLGASDFLSF